MCHCLCLQPGQSIGAGGSGYTAKETPPGRKLPPNIARLAKGDAAKVPKSAKHPLTAHKQPSQRAGKSLPGKHPIGEKKKRRARPGTVSRRVIPPALQQLIATQPSTVLAAPSPSKSQAASVPELRVFDLGRDQPALSSLRGALRGSLSCRWLCVRFASSKSPQSCSSPSCPSAASLERLCTKWTPVVSGWGATSTPRLFHTSQRRRPSPPQYHRVTRLSRVCRQGRYSTQTVPRGEPLVC